MGLADPSWRLIDARFGRACDGVSEMAISPTRGSLSDLTDSGRFFSRDQKTHADFEPSPGSGGGGEVSSEDA